jgi:hypothetical protein
MIGCKQDYGETTGDNQVFGSPLTKAISRGMQPEGNLDNELSELGDYSIISHSDAQAICRALKKLSDDPHDARSNANRFQALIGLFQDVESPEVPAFEVMRSQGVPLLLRFYDELTKNQSGESEDALLFALKVMAMYGSPEGTDRVIAAAKRPLDPEDYMWSVILKIYSENHPQTNKVFTALANPIPPGFIAVSLLDAANATALAGGAIKHPFDSPEGWKTLEKWLTAKEPDHFSYAHSATVALPFMSRKKQFRLLAIASKHPEVSVRMEAAWATAKVGNETGIRQLSEFCLDQNHSATACQYLEELGRAGAIPSAAKSPDFVAKAEFAQWLSHPNELGRPPDRLDIVDHRTLAWPPAGKKKDLWLIKYTVYDETGLEEDDIDVGMVGSTTFCLFSYKLAHRPPEDGYAIHCSWELEGQELLLEKDVDDPSEYASMITQWHGEELKSPEVIFAVEISPQLKYPQSVVAVASATLKRKQGWVVLDGDRSRWYPKDELPDAHKSTIAKLHIGRQLLGFHDKPDRKKYLAKTNHEKKPQEIVAAYERLLGRALKGNAYQQKSLIADSESPLGRHLTIYAKAYATVHATTEKEVIIRVYDQILALLATGSVDLKEAGYDTFTPIDEAFEDYVDALVKTNRSEKVLSLVTLLGPRWDHNLGYGKLGGAAYKAGDYRTAEHYLGKLRTSMENWERANGIGLLARIWYKQGKPMEAEHLLLESMQRIFADPRKAIDQTGTCTRNGTKTRGVYMWSFFQRWPSPA